MFILLNMCNCIPYCKDRQQHIQKLYKILNTALSLPVSERDSEYIFALKFTLKYEKEKFKGE